MASLRHRGPPLFPTSAVSSSSSAATFFLAILIILSLPLTHSSALHHHHHRHHQGKIVKNYPIHQRPVPSLHIIQTRHRRLEDNGHLDLYLAPQQPFVGSQKEITAKKAGAAAAPLRGFTEMLPKASSTGGIADIPTSGSSLCHNNVLENVNGGYYGKYYYYCGRKTQNGRDVQPSSTVSDP